MAAKMEDYGPLFTKYETSLKDVIRLTGQNKKTSSLVKQTLKMMHPEQIQIKMADYRP